MHNTHDIKTLLRSELDVSNFVKEEHASPTGYIMPFPDIFGQDDNELYVFRIFRFGNFL